MPAALGAVELIAVALFMFLLAFLYATKWTIHPLVGVLHRALGWIPFASSLVDEVDHAVIGALNSAIEAVEDVIVVLWHGVVWSFDQTLIGLEYFTLKALDALHFFRATVLPDFVHAITHPLRLALDAVNDRIDTLTGDIAQDVHDLHVAIRAAAAATYSDALAWVAQREADIRSDVRTWIEARAATIEHDITAFGDAAAAELPRLPGLALDDLEKLWNEVDWTKLAEAGGALALVYGIVHALEAETGLGNRECRGKVKQICSTDPSQWAQLLEGLALLGFAFTLPELVKIAEPIVAELEPLIQQAA